MRRRDFILMLAATVGPLRARADQRVRRVGVLMGGTDNPEVRLRLAAFQEGLRQVGWLDGGNISLDVRWGANDSERIIALARDLVQQKPDVILAGPTNAVLPLRNETRTIPIVFVQVSDPLGQGIVENLARPTGNLTGFSNLEFSLIGKWLQVLKEISPAIARVAVMIHTSNAVSSNWYRAFNTVAPSFAIEAIAAPITTRAEVESAIDAIAQARNGGLIVPSDTFVENPSVRRRIIELTATRRLPALYTNPAFVREGGLVSYGIDQIDPFRRAASYVDRILKGETPTDLPVQQPTKFELVINLKTAQALGLNVSPTLLAQADEVVE